MSKNTTPAAKKAVTKKAAPAPAKKAAPAPAAKKVAVKKVSDTIHDETRKCRHAHSEIRHASPKSHGVASHSKEWLVECKTHNTKHYVEGRSASWKEAQAPENWCAGCAANKKNPPKPEAKPAAKKAATKKAAPAPAAKKVAAPAPAAKKAATPAKKGASTTTAKKSEAPAAPAAGGKSREVMDAVVTLAAGGVPEKTPSLEGLFQLINGTFDGRIDAKLIPDGTGKHLTINRIDGDGEAKLVFQARSSSGDAIKTTAEWIAGELGL